ncbi:MAG: hypothetical protein M0Q53_19225 [Prolixibacteraceae bacterium]|jgi:hypothetical protein|nr:hypothetical protein [Prolixibacteraceae bacterium]
MTEVHNGSRHVGCICDEVKFISCPKAFEVFGCFRFGFPGLSDGCCSCGVDPQFLGGYRFSKDAMSLCVRKGVLIRKNQRRENPNKNLAIFFLPLHWNRHAAINRSQRRGRGGLMRPVRILNEARASSYPQIRLIKWHKFCLVC